LRHHGFLEAAHIIANAVEGEPRIPNGFALCKLHHAAFDCHIIGVTPDYRVEARLDVLNESDGPMLKHGLQGFHGGALWVPVREAHKPDRRFPEERYAVFQRAS
jgi:putative restriction endonuclease